MNYGRRIHAAGVIGALRIGGRVSQKIIKPPLISAEMIDGIVQTTRVGMKVTFSGLPNTVYNQDAHPVEWTE